MNIGKGPLNDGVRIETRCCHFYSISSVNIVAVMTVWEQADALSPPSPEMDPPPRWFSHRRSRQSRDPCHDGDGFPFG